MPLALARVHVLDSCWSIAADPVEGVSTYACVQCLCEGVKSGGGPADAVCRRRMPLPLFCEPLPLSFPFLVVGLILHVCNFFFFKGASVCVCVGVCTLWPALARHGASPSVVSRHGVITQTKQTIQTGNTKGAWRAARPERESGQSSNVWVR